MIVVYLIWLVLGAVGALAFGAVAHDMARRHDAIARPIAVVFGMLTAQHVLFVYLAARASVSASGPSGALLLTIAQGLVTPACCWLAARLLGWIGPLRQAGGSVDAKPWYWSKTIWINIVSLIMALAAYFAGPGLGLPDEAAHAAGIVLGAANVVNLWLRTVTNQPIAGTVADVPPRLRGKAE